MNKKASGLDAFLPGEPLQPAVSAPLTTRTLLPG
jgi:hypothetical protein